jgi:RNA polymerase sigma factor (sigma-70 family)
VDRYATDADRCPGAIGSFSVRPCGGGCAVEHLVGAGVVVADLVVVAVNTDRDHAGGAVSADRGPRRATPATRSRSESRRRRRRAAPGHEALSTIIPAAVYGSAAGRPRDRMRQEQSLGGAWEHRATAQRLMRACGSNTAVTGLPLTRLDVTSFRPSCNESALIRHCRDMSKFPDFQAAEHRFDEIFGHIGAVASYARHRGARDPEGLAADVMTIAWTRLPDVPGGDPRPWLFATARNLVFADWRRGKHEQDALVRSHMGQVSGVQPETLFMSTLDLDPALEAALRSLSLDDREALLLIAWEELTPAEAARSLGISPVAFRVRLHRARRRLRSALPESENPQIPTTSLTRSTHV